MKIWFENNTGLHEIDVNKLMATLEGFFSMDKTVDNKTAEEWLFMVLETNWGQNKILFKLARTAGGKRSY